MRHTSSRRARSAIAAAGVVAVLFTTACSAGAGSTPAGGDAPDGSITMSADDGSPTFERNFNPFSPTRRTATTYMYEPLEVINTIDGEGTPFLATEQAMPDAQTVTFTIRDGVKWSDGEPFSVEDVAFTFDLVRQTPALDTLGVWQHIESFEVDGSTIVFHMQGPDVPGATILAQQLIVPEHIWKDVEDPTTWKNEEPVVTGPYVLDTFTPNQYTLAKNTDYWQTDKVAIEQLVIPATNTQLEIVNKGYEWAYSFMSDVDETWVKADPEHNSYWFPPGGTVALFPNLTKAPFDDVHFRRGLSYALDRDQVALDAEEGYVEAAGQSGLLLPNQEAWLDPTLPEGGEIEQDLDKAAEEFALAGYTMKDGKLVDESGTQVALSMTTANGYTDWLKALRAVQKQFSAAGIDATIEQPQPAAYQQALNLGEFDLAIGGFGGTGNIYQDFNNLLNSQFATPVGETTSTNFQRFSDPEVDAALAALKAEPDEAAQQEIAYGLQQAVYEQLPAISLFYGGYWGLTSDREFTGWPSAENPYAPPIQWNSTPLLVFTTVTKAQ
ncbi:ABC transporter substrate-binding protein [Oerskovia turbata]